MSRPTPENRSCNHSTLSELSWTYQGSINLHGALPDHGSPPAGPPPDGSLLPTSPHSQSVQIPPPQSPDNPHELPAAPAQLHSHPKLFEHDVKKPIMFCVPIILRERGRLAEIFRVRFEPSLSVVMSHNILHRLRVVGLQMTWRTPTTSSSASGREATSMNCGIVPRTITSLQSRRGS